MYFSLAYIQQHTFPKTDPDNDRDDGKNENPKNTDTSLVCKVLINTYLTGNEFWRSSLATLRSSMLLESTGLTKKTFKESLQQPIQRGQTANCCCLKYLYVVTAH